MSKMAAACRAIEEDLSALIDEELAPEREAELREHLATCDRCARRLEELCNVDLVLASLPAPEVASDLRAQLEERLVEHERDGAVPARAEGRQRQAPPPRTRRWLGRRAAALAAVAAAALLAVFVTLRSGEAPEPDAPQIARPAPQVLPAQGPEPGVERRGEPLLAEQRSPGPEQEPPTQPEAARVELAEVPSPAREAAPVEMAEAGLEDLSEEDLALLLVLDEVEDLDVIANLELLENLRELEGMEGAG